MAAASLRRSCWRGCAPLRADAPASSRPALGGRSLCGWSPRCRRWSRTFTELETEIAAALDAHPDGEIFRSFFRSRDSVLCAASLLAEIGDCRARYPHRDAIAADGGQAPVAKESGKRKQATFRWACNKRLRNALATLAQSTRRWNPWVADRYAAARARGHNHRRALRTLGRAWARIIWRCWQTRTPYDPSSHTGLQQHVTAATRAAVPHGDQTCSSAAAVISSVISGRTRAQGCF
jgi:Transposase IS116/IS110/IS902 family